MEFGDKKEQNVKAKEQLKMKFEKFHPKGKTAYIPDSR